MTTTAIAKKKNLETIKLDCAAQIRELLDAARTAYGDEAWDEGDLETEVLALVTDEDEE